MTGASGSTLPFAFSIPAGGRLPVDISCELIHCISSTDVFYVQTPQDKIYFTSNVQRKFEVPLTGFNLINETASVVTGTLLLGFGEYSINNVTIGGQVYTKAVAPASLVDQPDIALVAAAAAVSVSAADATKRAVVLTSLSSSLGVARVGAAPAAGQGTPLEPGDSVTLNTSDAVKAFSTLGATICVTEIKS